MKKIMTLLMGALIAVACLQAQAATLLTQFISTVSDTSTLKESVQGCTTTSINMALNYNTVANLYSDGSFELGYDSNRNDDLLDVNDIIILTGVWSNIDAALTKFKFQPDGNLAIGNGTEGWLKIYDWTVLNACVAPQTNSNIYNLTYPATFRVLKSDMTINFSSSAGTLSFSLQGYGQTTTVPPATVPPKVAPLMKFDMQAKGFWYPVP